MTKGRFLIAEGALLLLVLGVFGRTAGHRFINFDDLTYVVKNPLVNQGFTLRGAFGSLQPQAANWHPLTWLSHMLDVELFGLRPGYHHLVNVLWHGANAGLLFAFLRALTGAAAPGFVVAALFAVHPLHVESVAWVAERKDVLCAFFSLLTMAAYLHWLRRPGRTRYLLVAALFALALAAKPMAVTLPLLLLLLDFWPLGRLRSVGPIRLFGEKAPLVALALADGLATYYAQHAGRARMVDPDVPLRVQNALLSYVAYLRQTVWPSGLAPLYPYPLAGFPWWEVAGAASLLILVSTTIWLRRRRDPELLAGWLWYLIGLLPVIGLHQVGAQARADRYTYLPLVGVFVAGAWWASARIADGWRTLAAAGTATAVVALAAAAWVQVGYWRDSATIMERTVRVTGPNPNALNNLGMALMAEQARPAAAVPHFEHALALKPDHRNAQFNLGEAQFRLGRYEAALAAFGRILAREPDDLEASYSAAAALFRLGRFGEAATAYERIVGAEPTELEARYYLGIALLKLERFEEALRQFAAIVDVDPSYQDARIQLMVALDGSRRAAAAGLTNLEKSK